MGAFDTWPAVAQVDNARAIEKSAAQLNVEATLQPHHIEQLCASGLSYETILACGFRSENSINEIRRILQNKRFPKKCGCGLILPYFSPDRTANGFERVKPDRPWENPRTGKAAKYLSPSGSSMRAYFPPFPLIGDAIADPKQRLILTEGEKKAAKACQEGFATIGLASVWGWTKGKRYSDSLIADLSTIDWKNREVIIAFDSDVMTNNDVEEAEKRLAVQLKIAGAKVRVARLPAGPDSEKVGLDDYLLTHTAAGLHQIINAATEPDDVFSMVMDKAKSLDPMETAKGFVDVYGKFGKHRSLWFWRDEFYAFDRYIYRKMALPELRAKLIEYINTIATHCTSTITNNTVDALKSLCIQSYRREMPTWLVKKPPVPAAECLVTKNKIVHLPTWHEKRDEATYPVDPRLFTTTAANFNFDPAAKCPAWHEFLDSLWSDDRECIGVLQELMGYLLLPDTSQQKLFLLVGPTRSGKGTIARIIGEIVGKENVAAPTLGSLQNDFGMQPLIGKTVAIVGDARLSGRSDIATITERLLSISGEDEQTINRKFLPQITVRLPTRFVILTNEIPELTDASGTLPGRFVMLPFTKTFYGREDRSLLNRLKQELPGILNWAIAGYQRLQMRRHFIQPASAEEVRAVMEELSSPVKAFFRDCCTLEKGACTQIEELWRVWQSWCKFRDKPVGDKQTLGRNLRAVAPAVKVRQPRVDGRRIRVYEGLKLIT